VVPAGSSGHGSLLALGNHAEVARVSHLPTLFRFPEPLLFADGGYAGTLVAWAKDKTHIDLEVVRRMPWMKGFVVSRRRWVVERTFAWIIKCRRLVRDYEQLTRTAETLITIAAVATLVRRWP
jgi:hypothetical protein